MHVFSKVQSAPIWCGEHLRVRLAGVLWIDGVESEGCRFEMCFKFRIGVPAAVNSALSRDQHQSRHGQRAVAVCYHAILMQGNSGSLFCRFLTQITARIVHK